MTKKWIGWLLLFCCLFGQTAWAEETTEPDIKAKHAVLMDASTGRILYSKDADSKAYPASTTKLMTAVLAAEALDSNTVLTASKTAVDIEQDGSNLGLLEGEQLTVEDLLYALLVHSANDAANVLAEAVSGDIASFVDLMNRRAGELGMSGTHFMNPHGYHDPEHYTTARDLAILTACAQDQPLVSQILSTPEYVLPPTNLHSEPQTLINTNSMITAKREYGYTWQPVKGGKTGHTSHAGYCFTAMGEQDGKKLISVVMGSVMEQGINYSFYDTKKVLEHGFTHFSLRPIVKVNEIVESVPVKWKAGGEQAALFADTTLNILLGREETADSLDKRITLLPNLRAPLKKGDKAGELEYYYNDVFLGRVNLVVAEDVSLDVFEMIFGTILFYLKKPVVWGILLAVFVASVIMKTIRRQQRRRRRQQRYRR